MRTGIFYFTGTGNSLSVSYALKRRLPEAEIVSIPRVLEDEDIPQYDRAVIVFPVYMFGIPLIIERFISRVKASSCVWYALATMGGMAGNALIDIQNRMRERGVSVSGAWALRMPGNYTPLYGAESSHKQERYFRRMEESLDTIYSFIGAGKSYPVKRSVFSGLFFCFYRMASPQIPEMDKKFFCDARCTRCGVCARVCPVGNISLDETGVQWHHRCEQCMACLQWCPVASIQFTKKTIGRRRYRHPECTLKDMEAGSSRGKERTHG